MCMHLGPIYNYTVFPGTGDHRKLSGQTRLQLEIEQCALASVVTFCNYKLQMYNYIL